MLFYVQRAGEWQVRKSQDRFDPLPGGEDDVR